MAYYGNGVYGTSLYGGTPLLAFSVAPFSLVILDFNKTSLAWQPPTGSYTKVRIVRNQASFPEHSEDGIIIYEESTSSASLTGLLDGDTALVPIVPGKPIYYTYFVFTSDKIWVNAGSVSGVVPSSHDMQNKTISYLPRVYTSVEQSPLAEPNTSSDLYKFLDGFSFTIEESLTYLDLLNPDHTLIATPSALLPLEVSNYGLTPEPGLPVKNQKSLVREAVFMYTHKGTKNGLSAYVEALSGYAPTITQSANLMLTSQDSTFYKGTGNWIPTGGTLAASTAQTPNNVTNSIDTTYTCAITATGAGSMVLGKTDPIIKGVPLVPGTTYTFSAQIKSPSSAGTITPKIGIKFVIGYI